MTYISTTNGALQHESSGNKCIDLFSVIGNLRECSRTDILERFESAFDENPEKLKCIYSGKPARHEVIYAKSY